MGAPCVLASLRPASASRRAIALKRGVTDSPGLGSLASGALTAASTLVVAGVAAVVGVVIAREFGRTEETDGFFAAYGVFIVLVLAAQAIRIATIPALARARGERRLAGEVAGYAIALSFVAIPLVVLTELFASEIARVLTGDGSALTQDAAADALRWMIPAAALHLYAGLTASGLAALDDYATAAAGYAVGSLAGLVFIVVRVEDDGLIAVAWGMTLNAALAFAVPFTGLVLRAARGRMPGTAMRPTGPPVGARILAFAEAAALPIAIQMLYVVCLPFAGRLDTGAVTSFGYAYLAAASLVTVTAFSLGLVTSAPLSRGGLDAEGTARHIVAAAWIALVLIGAAAGVFAVVGADIVEVVLGDAFGGDVGAEVARLVVLLSPWIVVSVGVNTAFPLAFVVGRTRLLPVIAVVALALQVFLAWVAVEVAELDGLALALAVSTLFVLVALLRELGALRPTLRGLCVAAAFVFGLALLAFVPPALLLGAAAAGAVGLVAYCVLVALVRPRGFTDSWAYLRALR